MNRVSRITRHFTSARQAETIDGKKDFFGYEGQATLYRKFRPRYPASLLEYVDKKRLDDWLEEKTGGLINSVPGYKFMKNTIKGAHKEKMDRLKKANYPKLKAPDVRDYYGPDGKKKSK